MSDIEIDKAIQEVVDKSTALGALAERERIITALKSYMGWGETDMPTMYDVYFRAAINIINGDN